MKRSVGGWVTPLLAGALTVAGCASPQAVGPEGPVPEGVKVVTRSAGSNGDAAGRCESDVAGAKYKNNICLQWTNSPGNYDAPGSLGNSGNWTFSSIEFGGSKTGYHLLTWPTDFGSGTYSSVAATLSRTAFMSWRLGSRDVGDSLMGEARYGAETKNDRAIVKCQSASWGKEDAAPPTPQALSDQGWNECRLNRNDARANSNGDWIDYVTYAISNAPLTVAIANATGATTQVGSVDTKGTAAMSRAGTSSNKSSLPSAEYSPSPSCSEGNVACYGMYRSMANKNTKLSIAVRFPDDATGGRHNMTLDVDLQPTNTVAGSSASSWGTKVAVLSCSDEPTKGAGGKPTAASCDIKGPTDGDSWATHQAVTFWLKPPAS